MSTLRRTNVYFLTCLTFGGLWTDTCRFDEEQTSTSWQAWRLVDCGLIQVNHQRTNVYSLTDLMFGGLWTGKGRPNEEQTSMP